MTRYRLSFLLLLLCHAALHGEYYSWVGGASGSWENSANWISGGTPQHGGIPGHGDYANIPPATNQQGHPLLTTVILSSAVSTGLSYIGGDTTLLITGSGTLTLEQPATVSDGYGYASYIALYGSIANYGHLNIPGFVFYNLNAQLYGYNNLGSITNYGSGLIDIQDGASMIPYWNYGVGYIYTIHNYGIIRESGGLGASFDAYLDNHGTVQSQSGTLRWRSGSNLGGTFQADAGAGIEFSGGTITLTSTITNFNGPGTVWITTAEVVLNNFVGTLDLYGSLVRGTIANGGVLNFHGGSVRERDNPTAGVLQVSAGAVLNLMQRLVWDFQNYDCGVNGTLSVLAGGKVNQNASLSISGTLTNAGIYNLLEGSIGSSSDASITNAVGGLFDIRCDTQLAPWNYYYGYTSTFHNAGTLRKSAGGGTTSFYDYLDNTGTVQLQSGGLNFSGGTNLGGTFQAVAGTGIAFNGGTFTLSAPPSNFFGPGGVSITTAEVVLNNFAGTLDLYGSKVSGTIANGGVLNLRGGEVNADTSLVLTSGAVLNLTDEGWGHSTPNSYYGLGLAGTLSVQAGATVNQNITLSISGTLTNAGIYNLLEGSIGSSSDASITNAVGGLFDIRCDTQLAPWNYYYGYTSTFHNAGTLRKSAGDGTTSFVDYLDNTGTVQVQSGGLNFSGGTNLGGTFQAVAGTGIAFNGGTFTLSAPPSNFFGPGAVSITTAEVVLNNFAGTLDLYGSKIRGTIANGGVLNLRGGTLKTGDTLEVASGGTLNLSDEGWGSWSYQLGNLGFYVSDTASLSVQAGGIVNQLDTLFVGGTLTNAGTHNWISGGILTSGPTASITNAVGGLFDIHCDNSLYPVNYYYGNTSTFHNEGTLRKSAGDGTTSFVDYLDNTGTVQARSGHISFQGGAALSSGHVECVLSGVGLYGTIDLGATSPAGALSIILGGAYHPVGGESFALVHYDSLDAGFSSITFPGVTNWEAQATENNIVVVIPFHTVESWRETYFGSSASTGNGADTADPYHTGIANLSVFAFMGANQNPALVRPSQLPQPQKMGDNLVVSFSEPSGISGITYGAEYSPSLEAGSWEPVPDTGSGTTHTFSVPIGLFLRLRVASQ